MRTNSDIAAPEPARSSLSDRLGARVRRFLADGRVIAAGGLLAGGLVGVGLDKAYEALTTRLLDVPTLEDVFEQQKSSFATIEKSLAELRSSAPAEVSASIAKLRRELGSQEAFAKQYQVQLIEYAKETAELRQQLRAEKGFSGGAEFWVGVGESVRLAGEHNVLGVVGRHGGGPTVNLNDERSRLTIGDSREFSADGRACRLIVRQLRRPADSRFGFDTICEKPAPAPPPR